MTTLGVWAPQGTVIPAVSGDSPQQPNVIFEGNAQILSGNVFKCWFDNNVGLCYAESTNGTSFTRYAGGTGGLVLSGVYYPTVFENAGTYYCYAAPNNTFPSPAINAYTSTNFGITWALAKANTLVVGGVGTWDHAGVFQLNVLGIVAGTWYGYYAGTANAIAPFAYAQGLVTSADGLNWTKSPSNPVIFNQSLSNFKVSTVNGAYYGWSQILLADIPGGSGALPSDITRYSAVYPQGPWTPLGTPTIYRTNTTDGVGLTTLTGQVADPTALIFDGTNTWMFADADVTGTAASSVIEVFKAVGMTPAQVVATREGVQNFPIPDGFSLQLVQQAQETFSGTHALGSEWTPATTGVTNTVVGGFCTASVVSTQATSYYNLLGSLGAQWSQVTVGTYGTNGFFAPCVMVQSGGVQLCYKGNWHSTSGSTGSWLMQKVTAGPTFTDLIINGSPINAEATGTMTVNPGDTLTLVAVPNGGTTELTMFWNQVMVCTASDTAFTSGYPGIYVEPTSSSPSLQGNASITAFAAGTLQQAPPPPPVGGSPGSMMLMGCGT